MGIVAFCPNGHRVKVKDEFAGRKGICPTCAARFRIPFPNPRAAMAPGVGSEPPAATIISRDPQLAATLPAARALPDAAAFDANDEPVDIAADFAPLPDEPAADASSTDSPPQPYPALDERPDLAWCIAVRGGTPSAPLAASAMRAWLASGEVSADHVVWRQDWPDWRPVAEVFPGALPPQPPG